MAGADFERIAERSHTDDLDLVALEQAEFEKSLREMIGAVNTDDRRRRVQGKFRKWQHELTRRVAERKCS